MLTTSSPASQGILGAADTRVLYGGDRQETRHDDEFNGVRIGVQWMNADNSLGVEARAFFLERDSTYFKAVSDGSELLAMPYYNPVLNREEARIIAGPAPGRGFLSGGFVGYSRIEWYGEDVNAVVPLAVESTWRLDLLAGLRFFQMRDRFEDTATSRTQPDGATLWGVTDNYRVGNAFYGGQVGVRGESWFGRFFVQARATIALGGDDERVRAFGQAIYQTPQIRVVSPVGLYVQPSNTGQFTRVNFDGAGEAAINVGYQLTSWARVYAGYTFLYWADPLRAGDQVDMVVNRAQGSTPTPVRPLVTFKGDALWAQGVNAGLELRW